MRITREILNSLVRDTFSLAARGWLIFLLGFTVLFLYYTLDSVFILGIERLVVALVLSLLSTLWLGTEIYLLKDAKSGEVAWPSLGSYLSSSFKQFWPLFVFNSIVIPIFGFLLLMFILSISMAAGVTSYSEPIGPPPANLEITKFALTILMYSVTALVFPFISSFASIVVLLKTPFLKAIPKTFAYLRYNFQFYFLLILMSLVSITLFAGYKSLIELIPSHSLLLLYLEPFFSRFNAHLVAFITTCFAVSYISKYRSIPDYAPDYGAINRVVLKVVFLFVMAGLVVFQMSFMYRLSNVVAKLMSAEPGVQLQRVDRSVGFPYSLQRGDLIKSINEVSVKENKDAIDQFANHAGETVSLQIDREDQTLVTEVYVPQSYPAELIGMQFTHKYGLERAVSKNSPSEISLILLYHSFVTVVLTALWVVCAFFIRRKGYKWYYVSILFGMIFAVARLVGV